MISFYFSIVSIILIESISLYSCIILIFLVLLFIFVTVLTESSKLKYDRISDQNFDSSFEKKMLIDGVYLNWFWKSNDTNPRLSRTSSVSFPLIFENRIIETSLKAIINRCFVRLTNSNPLSKELNPIMLTSGPSGSGKTHFLTMLTLIINGGLKIPYTTKYMLPTSIENCVEIVDNIKKYILECECKLPDQQINNETCQLNDIVNNSYAIYIAMNNDTPLSEFEIKTFDYDSAYSIIARVLYHESRKNMSDNKEFGKFIKIVAPIIVENKLTLNQVIESIREYRNTTLIVLNIDEIVLIQQEYKSVLCNDKNQNQDIDKMYPINSLKRKWHFVTKSLAQISQLMISDGNFFSVLSSIEMSALETYIGDTQLATTFVPLSPINQRIMKELLVYLLKLANSVNGTFKFHLNYCLNLVSGHPKTLQYLLPYLTSLGSDYSKMTLRLCESNIGGSVGRITQEIVDAALLGKFTIYSTLEPYFGMGGVVSRPTNFNSQDDDMIPILSPLAVNRAGRSTSDSYTKKLTKALVAKKTIL